MLVIHIERGPKRSTCPLFRVITMKLFDKMFADYRMTRNARIAISSAIYPGASTRIDLILAKTDCSCFLRQCGTNGRSLCSIRKVTEQN